MPCGQAAVSEMLSRRLPEQRPQLIEAKNAYLHSARLLLLSDGVTDAEACTVTDTVYAERLAIHEGGWVK